MENLLKFTGIAGFAIAVLLFVFRDILRKNIFPMLTKRQAYNVLRLIIISVSIIALAAFVLYYFTKNKKTQEKQTTYGDVFTSGRDIYVAKDGGTLQIGTDRAAYKKDTIDTSFIQFVEANRGKTVWIETVILFNGYEGDDTKVDEIFYKHQKTGFKLDNVPITKFFDHYNMMGGFLRSLNFSIHEEEYAGAYESTGTEYIFTVNEQELGAIRLFRANDGIEIKGYFKVKNYSTEEGQGYFKAELTATQ